MYNLQKLGVVARIVSTQFLHKNKKNLLRLQKRDATNFRRPALSNLLPDQMQELRMKMLQHGQDFSGEEWQQIRNTLTNNYKHIKESNVDAVILGLCNEGDLLKAAKSYVAHLKKLSHEPNMATIGRLLKVYHLKYQSTGVDSLSAEEQLEILTIYMDIREKYDFLDATTCENLIHGIVATDNWLDGLEMLKMIKLSATPSVAAYNVLIVKAFRVADLETGWTLLNEMLQERKQPKCDVFITYLKTIAKEEKSFLQKFELLLEFIGRNEIILTSAVCQQVFQLAEQYPHLLEVATTQLNRFGKCSGCGNHMQNVSISNEEFEQLSDSFLNKVLIRKDVFQKSTPEELDRFKKFVVETGPYDCVVDGLNVAYSMGTKKSPSFLANLLASVVKYFNNNNKHILILGRKHMNNWPRDTMIYIKKYARVFLTNDLSQDDPFLLYATIKSGQSTDFFSRDLMRSHAYLLGPELKTIFRRWQQEHQYSLVTQTQNGKIIIKEPIRHMIYAHKVKSTWHIPSKLEYSSNPSENFEVPENWLCVNFQKN